MTVQQTESPAAWSSAERDVRPMVTLPRRGLSTAALLLFAVLLGLVLFAMLDVRRRSISAPAVTAGARHVGSEEAIPPLYIPPEVPTPQPTSAMPLAPSRLVEAAPDRPRIEYLPPPPLPVQPQPFVPPQPLERSARTSAGSVLVFDTSQPRGAAEPGSVTIQTGAFAENGGTAVRVRASAITNRSTTVPQGTLIAAVLETAFNSTRSGLARALVQRDVHGFDGRRVLIPRGSRLIGEYRSDATAGQRRAFINWTRLVRPDGATIALGSPATDPVGTGGVRAKVDSHFFERFSGAILQSVLDVGVNLAARSSSSPVIVAFPGSVQGSAGNTVAAPTSIPPTLSVRQGTSVSVFVARDLDFTDVEAGR